MKHLALALSLGLGLVVGQPALAAADAPAHVINESDVTSTLDCGDGGSVVLNGADCRITITGGCAKVVINGADNEVVIDAADKIAINGADNKVAWKKAWKSKGPKISRVGADNKVRQIK